MRRSTECLGWGSGCGPGAWGPGRVGASGPPGSKHSRARGAGSARTTAWRAALAVALGAFGIAVAANVHALAASSRQHSLAHVLSLILWPVMTALPAFLVAWAAAAGLSLERRGD